MLLGSYRVLLKLGEGGMGHVFLAEEDGPTPRLVVLKQLKEYCAADPELREAFHREALLTARLRHPGIVQTFAYLEHEDLPIIAMEYLEGVSYGELARRRDQRLPWPLHLAVLRQLLVTLAYLQDSQDLDGRPLEVVHRDISPQNLQVTFDGQVKLLDFGIAKSTLATSHLTEPGVFRGRLHYSAPERVTTAPPDPRSDLFSVGVMIWEAYAKERFWGARRDYEVLAYLGRGSLPDHELSPPPPAALRTLLERALAADPAQRWQSAAAMLEALEPLLDSAGPDARDPEALRRFLQANYGDARAARRQDLAEARERAATPEEATPSQARGALISRPRASEPLTPSSRPPAPTLDEPSSSSLAPPPTAPAQPRRPRWLFPVVVPSLLAMGAALSLWHPWQQSGPGGSGALTPGSSGTSTVVDGSTSAPAPLPPAAAIAPAGSLTLPPMPGGSASPALLLPPARPCSEPFVLIDFEDGFVQPCRASGRQGRGFFYWDGTGRTDPPPGLLHHATLLPEPRGGSRWGLHLRGSGLRDWGAGVAIILRDGKPVDLRGYSGLTLWARTEGPPTNITIKLATPDTLDESYGGRCTPQGKLGCDDHFGGSRALAPPWTKYHIAFDDLKQEGWGRTAEWHPERVVELHVSIVRRIPGAIDFNLWLDDVRFY